MKDDAAGPSTRVEGHTVQALHGAASAQRDRPRSSKGAPPVHHAKPHAAPAAEPTPPASDLSFNADAQRIVVQVVDRESGSVVRSVPLVLPGPDVAPDEETPRGALVDAKA